MPIGNTNYGRAVRNEPDTLLKMASQMAMVRAQTEKGFSSEISEDAVMYLPNDIDRLRRGISRHYIFGDMDVKAEVGCPYGIIREAPDYETFFDRIGGTINGFTNCVRVGNRFFDFIGINSFTAEEFLPKMGNIPVIHLEPSLRKMPEKQRQELGHQMSHAFGMNFADPEQVYGYRVSNSRTYQNSGAWYLRLGLKEWIANLEAGEKVSYEMPNGVFLDIQGRRKDQERFENVREDLVEAVQRAEEQKMKVIDLTSMLRVIPVQEMKRTLPEVIKRYEEKGLEL